MVENTSKLYPKILLKIYLTLTLLQVAFASFDPTCYITSNTIYGGIEGDLISDINLFEAFEASLTMKHRVTQVHACYDMLPSVTSPKLNGLMLTIGVPEDINQGDSLNLNTTANRTFQTFNLNTFGQMEGQCSSFNLNPNENIISLELAYNKNESVTSIRIATDSGRLVNYGFVSARSLYTRFTFAKDKPWIGLSGYATTKPIGLAPLQLKTDCVPKLSIFDKHRAIIGFTNYSSQIDHLIESQYDLYADVMRKNGSKFEDYSISKMPSGVCLQYQPPFRQWIMTSTIFSEKTEDVIYKTVAAILALELILLVIGLICHCSCERRRNKKLGQVEMTNREVIAQAREEGGEKAEVIYVYQDLQDDADVMQRSKCFNPLDSNRALNYEEDTARDIENQNATGVGFLLSRNVQKGVASSNDIDPLCESSSQKSNIADRINTPVSQTMSKPNITPTGYPDNKEQSSQLLSQNQVDNITPLNNAPSQKPDPSQNVTQQVLLEDESQQDYEIQIEQLDIASSQLPSEDAETVGYFNSNIKENINKEHQIQSIFQAKSSVECVGEQISQNNNNDSQHLDFYAKNTDKAASEINLDDVSNDQHAVDATQRTEHQDKAVLFSAPDIVSFRVEEEEEDFDYHKFKQIK